MVLNRSESHGSSSIKQSAIGYAYDQGASGSASSLASATTIVPILVEIFHPSSVVDLGCGLGTWLSVFRSIGIEIKGFDGAWVPREHLVIPDDCFGETDFRTHFEINGHFDLALCLEVAEHLEERFSAHLLDVLTSISDVVCFSAAVPGQGGFGHVNERFQEYWVDEFRSRGFSAVDLVRPRIWMSPAVSYWYQQNLIVYVSAKAMASKGISATPFASSMVHPDLYEKRRDPRNYSLKAIMRLFPYYIGRTVKARRSRTA